MSTLSCWKCFYFDISVSELERSDGLPDLLAENKPSSAAGAGGGGGEGLGLQGGVGHPHLPTLGKPAGLQDITIIGQLLLYYYSIYVCKLSTYNDIY